MQTRETQNQQKSQKSEESAQATTGQNATQRAITHQPSGEGLARPLGYERGWGPFRLLSRMFEDIDRMLGLDTEPAPGWSPFGALAPRPGWGEMRSLFRPEVEVFERDNKLVVRADLPGIDEKDINVKVDEGVLTISGERKQDVEEKREGYYRSERSYGYFERSVALPEGVDPNQVEARFNSGVLEIEAPVPEQRRRGRTVPIAGGEKTAGALEAAAGKGSVETGTKQSRQTSEQQKRAH